MIDYPSVKKISFRSPRFITGGFSFGEPEMNALVDHTAFAAATPVAPDVSLFDFKGHQIRVVEEKILKAEIGSRPCGYASYPLAQRSDLSPFLPRRAAAALHPS